jgi:hypothetical protein
MRDGSITGPWQYGEIICPLCFAELASEQGITGPHWVWNPETWLWDTPGEGMRHDYVDALGHAPLRTDPEAIDDRRNP